MLVLSRRVDERIVIDGDIEVVVIAVQGGRVKLGFNAPSHVKIYRTEIHPRCSGPVTFGSPTELPSIP
jgi:carbon storage regulator